MTGSDAQDPTAPRLHPRDAVAAIIVVPQQGYLLQLRDNRPDIFFPDHWGLFGGAIEAGESEEAALRRELAEEIGVDLPPGSPRYVTRIDIDWNRPGCGWKTRAFFEVILSEDRVRTLILREGAELRVFPADQIRDLRVAPYDAFGLWLHINHERVG